VDIPGVLDMKTPANTPKKAISYQRFSSIAQGTEGRDSKQRQGRAIELALKKHNLELDGEFHDWGRSAYHKRHISKGGGLYELRRLAVDGKLKSKVLVLENWDRYGRLQATDACPLLMDMLNNSVELVVGADGGEFFSREIVNANPFLLYRAIDEMNRGFAESKRKSDMAKSKWQGRREAIESGKFTPLNSLPWWLVNGKDRYEFKPKMKELIKEIFDMYLSGYGSQTVAIKLNERNVPLPPMKNGGNRVNANGWHPTYIQNLIKNRALIGYYFKSEHKIFPLAISEKDFYAANKKRMDRKCFAGRRAQHINPYMGLCRCAVCGGHVITHHSGVKKYGALPYAYLQCSNSRRAKCSAAGLSYRVFEESFSIVWEDKEMAKAFMGENNDQTSSQMTELQGKLAVIESRVRQVKADYIQTPSKALASIMAAMEEEEAKVKKELEAVTISVRGTASNGDAWERFREIFPGDDWDDPENRLKAQECLRDTVAKIEMDILGKAYTVYFKGSNKQLKVTELSRFGFKANGYNYRLMDGVLKYEQGMNLRQISQEHKEMRAMKEKERAEAAAS
jgi:DNA invertase Pin-like site-specific DNA recombinase